MEEEIYKSFEKLPDIPTNTITDKKVDDMLDDIDQEEYRNNHYVVLRENKKLREKKKQERKNQKNLEIMNLYSRKKITNSTKLKDVVSNRNSQKINFDFLFNKRGKNDGNKKDIFMKLKIKSRSCTNLEDLLSNKSKIINDLMQLVYPQKHQSLN